MVWTGLNRVDCIAVVDFGGQYCHLIARRIRELKVYSEIVDYREASSKLSSLEERFNVKGIVLSGGPSSVYGEDAPRCDLSLVESGLPVLGICYGHQLLAYLYGGVVEPSPRAEYGVAEVELVEDDVIFRGLDAREKVWMSHRDCVSSLPRGFKVLARSSNCPVAAFRAEDKPIYGVQWHPEVAHTVHGVKLLSNFVFEVCGCREGWVIEDFVARAVREVREAVGGGRCVIALSGGVDSSTAAVIAAKALAGRLTAVLVDHGFMREGEVEHVKSVMARLGVNLKVVDARKRFLERLRGVTDPEEKRRIIGEEFIRVFEEEAERIGAEYLVQGTIYPDRIESGVTRASAKIKTHHNVGGLPSKIKFKAVVEPLRDLYKDEVRRVAELLGLPPEIVWRQPFPGPGLAVRILGEVTEEKLRIAKASNRIVEEEVEKAGLSRRLWQYFAVVTDSRSVGVKGDAREYGYVVAVRMVESVDAMTASFAKIPYTLLERIATRIVNEVEGVSRVVYDVTHKPPATIEWE